VFQPLTQLVHRNSVLMHGTIGRSASRLR
jgi:hypothetical protein